MKKILVVIDMQNDFIDGSLGTKEAVSIVPKVKEKIEQALKQGAQLCFTLDTHTEEYLNTLEGKKLPVMHCVEGTPGWYLNKELESVIMNSLPSGLDREEFYNGENITYNTSSVCVFKKDIFGSTALAQYIQRQYTENPELDVELVGLCTDICVVSNALLLRSMVPQLTIKVDASCCAGVTPESHAMALQTMKMCQIEVE